MAVRSMWRRSSERFSVPLTLLGAILILGGCVSGKAMQSGSMPDVSVEPEWTALPAIPGWTSRVKAARGMEDSSARADSLLALVRQALDGTGMQIFVAGTSSPTAVVPEDYRPVPMLNFDANLNEKTSRKFTPKTHTRSLKNDAGYYFTNNLIPYVVLGPLSIDVRDPDFLRMYTEHELYHAHHHVGSHAPLADRELETWTMQFRHWFYKIHQYRQPWGPLALYYEKATPDAQKHALDALVGYYRNPPSDRVAPNQVSDARSEFEAWLHRRQRDKRTKSLKLIKALTEALQLPDQ